MIYETKNTKNAKKKKVATKTMNTKNKNDMKNKVLVKTKENGGNTDCGRKTNKEGGGIASEVNIFFLLYLFSIFA